MDKPKKPPEKLAQVKINNGQYEADLVRECDPSGAIVEHRVRKSSYVHEGLLVAGKLVPELYDAAEKFRHDFERAQLAGNYARLDMFKTRAGKQEMSNGVAAAKMRIHRALDALGGNSEMPSFFQSCIWNVVGLGLTLDAWTNLVRENGGSMNADKASGVLHVTLERLALHYGMIDPGRMVALRQESAYGRAIKDFIDFVNVFATTAQGMEKTVVGKLLTGAQMRFGRFV